VEKHCPEGSRRLGKQLAALPVHDDAVTTDQVERVELAATVAHRDLFGVLGEPAAAGLPDQHALGGGRRLVELVLGPAKVDLTYDDTVVLAGA
jgi:hypothetical protein